MKIQTLCVRLHAWTPMDTGYLVNLRNMYVHVQRSEVHVTE